MTVLLEIILLGTAVVTGGGLAAYGVIAFRAHRAAQEQACHAADQAPALNPREIPSGPERSGQSPSGYGVRAGRDVESRPLDAWVDDTLRHTLDDL